MKRIAVVLAVMLALLPVYTGWDLSAYAKGGGGSSFSGGSRSFSSSSFSSSRSSFSSSYSKPSLPSSSSGYSKPTTSTWGSRSSSGVVSTPAASKPTATSSGYTKPTATTTSTTSGYSKPTTSGTAAAVTPQKATFSSKSTFDKNATASIQKQKSADSLSAYKADKDKFKGNDRPFDKSAYTNNGLYKSAPVYGGYNAQRQITVRNTYYTTNRYTPPVYYTSFSPSYGVFDTMFMFWMLDSIHTNHEAQMMAHNYRNDPGYQQWRRDAEKQAETNAELKAKLATMDAEMAKLKDKPVDPNYVPKGIPSEAIVSPQAMMAKTPAKAPIVFASGQKSGRYYSFAQMLKDNATGASVNVEQTAGSMDNLKLLLAGKADMAIVQSDALAMFDQEFPGQKLSVEQSELYPEFMLLIVNHKSGITSIKDMLDGKTEVCFPKGSGSAVSWDALCAQDPKYKKIPVKYVASNDACLDEVVKNSKIAMFAVSALNSPVLQRAEKIAKEKNTLRLASVDDTHLLDKADSHGNKIYSYYEVSKETFPNLQYRWYWNRSVATLSVQAILVLRTEWVKQYGAEALDSITLSVLETKSEINRTVNTPKI